MKYKKIYKDIIEKAKSRQLDGYKESHHILPKSLGGSDEKDNLVYLTAREHFLCHYLLTKMYEEETIEYYKMLNAFIIMKATSISHNYNRYFNSHLYESKKIEFSKMQSMKQSGKGNSQHGTIWIHNLELKESKKIPKSEFEDWTSKGWLKGRKMKFVDEPERFCLECGKPTKNQKYCSNSCAAKNRDNPFAGKKHSEDSKLKMKKKHKENNHNSKEKNPNFGKIWIYNKETMETKMILKEDFVNFNSNWLKGHISRRKKDKLIIN